jgi:hypothetical protein
MPHAVNLKHVTYGPNSYSDGSAARGSLNEIRCKRTVAVTVTEEPLWRPHQFGVCWKSIARRGQPETVTANGKARRRRRHTSRSPFTVTRVPESASKTRLARFRLHAASRPADDRMGGVRSRSAVNNV